MTFNSRRSPTRSSRTARWAAATMGAIALMLPLSAGVASSAIAAAPASAAQAGPNGVDDHAPAFANAHDLPSSGAAPTLTNDVTEPAGGTAWQLVLGFGLFGVSLIALAVGVAAATRERRGTPPGRGALDGRPRAGHP